MIEFRFRLDEEIYADEITAIRKLAGKKSLSKTMPKIITQWYMSIMRQEVVNTVSETWQNEDKNELADSLSSLKFD
jgi:hypothetical protein